MPRPTREHSLLDTTALNFAIDVVIAHRSRPPARRMTVEMAAAESGVNEATFSNLRNGLSTPSLDNTLALLRWLGDLPVSRFTRPCPGACALCGEKEPTATVVQGAA